MTRKFCHHLIKKTAIEFAEAQYEEMAKDNTWYKLNPYRKEWVRDMWQHYIPSARAILTAMLSRPIAEELKEQIHDALIKDHSVSSSRISAVH